MLNARALAAANGRLQDIGGGSKRPRAGNDMGGAAGAPKRQAVHHANTPALEWSGQNGYHHHSVALTEADSCQQQVADFADIVQQVCCSFQLQQSDLSLVGFVLHLGVMILMLGFGLSSASVCSTSKWTSSANFP